MPPLRSLISVAAAALLLSSCSRSDLTRAQGYAEGEYIYVASPIGGELKDLFVERGATVPAGTPLFQLDDAREKAVRDEAQRKLDQANFALEDARKGKRPSEIAALEAQLKQAQATALYSEKEFARQERLMQAPGSTSQADFERSRATRDSNAQQISRLNAELETAKLGLRDDQIAAAQAAANAADAGLRQAEWELSQKRRAAGEAGLVFDTYYRPGEWVAPGRPVVALLPPSHMKVRAFVAEEQVGALKPGQQARVFIDGVAEPVDGRVSFISPRAEFTPPVIYSNESRGKLVFTVELRFADDAARKLHPGQPVDVEFGG